MSPQASAAQSDVTGDTSEEEETAAPKTLAEKFPVGTRVKVVKITIGGQGNWHLHRLGKVIEHRAYKFIVEFSPKDTKAFAAGELEVCKNPTPEEQAASTAAARNAMPKGTRVVVTEGPQSVRARDCSPQRDALSSSLRTASAKAAKEPWSGAPHRG